MEPDFQVGWKKTQLTRPMIIAHNQLPFFKMFSNRVDFLAKFLTILPFFSPFLNNHMHVLTF